MDKASALQDFTQSIYPEAGAGQEEKCCQGFAVCREGPGLRGGYDDRWFYVFKANDCCLVNDCFKNICDGDNWFMMTIYDNVHCMFAKRLINCKYRLIMIDDLMILFMLINGFMVRS